MCVVLNDNQVVSITSHGNTRKIFFFKANKSITVDSTVVLTLDVLTKLSQVL